MQDEAYTMLAEFMPKFSAHSIQLTLKVVTAAADIVRVQLITTMRMRYEGSLDRLGFDLLEMTDSTDTMLIFTARRKRQQPQQSGRPWTIQAKYHPVNTIRSAWRRREHC
jgi:hypothetical protein